MDTPNLFNQLQNLEEKDKNDQEQTDIAFKDLKSHEDKIIFFPELIKLF